MRIVRKILRGLSLCIFITSLLALIFTTCKKKEEANNVSRIREIKLVEEQVVIQKETPIILREVEEEQIKYKYKKLYSENSDLYGWIKIDETNIDYPVMRSTYDPQFYLNRDWEKKESLSGLIFADYRTENNSNNTIIYGHNMKNGTMFGTLKKYKNEKYYKKHKYIDFDNLYNGERYQIIIVAGINIHNMEKKDLYNFFDKVEFESEEEFYEYIKYAKKNEFYDTGNMAEYGDKLITLVTCDSSNKDNRIVIIAIKI